ncbi:MAG: site-specific integrase [Holosporaceae bacterium]|jgi:site-specific recombinase XerD|nr:site-specific integrase [Holosporaceae bacterium]
MATNWIKVEGVKGISYREHATRIFKKHKDRYFAAFYKLDGKTKCEAFGWESDGWTTEKVVAILQELKQNQKTGQGPHTLAGKREQARKQREKEAETTATFSEIFEKYIMQAKQDKSVSSYKNEVCFFKNWLQPVMGELTMAEITPDTLNSLKKTILENGRTPRTATYILAVVRQVFNYAKNYNLYLGDNPVSKIKKPTCDNRRIRFLTKKEANALLEYLKGVSRQLHDMAFLSLYCGLRAGEIFSLTWNDVDFEHEILSIKDTKSGQNRNAIMTPDAKKMLEENKRNPNSNGFVFISTVGTKTNAVSKSFARAVEALGFNNGIDDPRQKVVFHTLRHTYASWLVMSGVDLYTVQKLMGHSTISMTERYSHLAPDHLKKAVKMLVANYA